jgi:glycerophosphoryl diester phosphodiesterase
VCVCGGGRGGILLLTDSDVDGFMSQVLERYGYGGAIDTKRWQQQPAFIQSFEIKNLQWLKQQTELPLVQLIDDPALYTADTNQSYAVRVQT